MIDISKIKVGDKVHYLPKHYKNSVPIFEEDGLSTDGYEDHWENGIVKEVYDWNDKEIRVVFNCADDWENYKNYTSALTSIFDLNLGWKHE